MNLPLWSYFLIAVVLWLAILTIWVLRVTGNFKRLTRGSNNVNLTQLLENIVQKQDQQQRKTEELASVVGKIESQNIRNFQKHALVRFNPFEDTGGDQSFVAAFLDGENNGIVISSLHTRSGTRVYAKQVFRGKSTTHQFSKEEKEVVEKAAHQVRLGQNLN